MVDLSNTSSFVFQQKNSLKWSFIYLFLDFKSKMGQTIRLQFQMLRQKALASVYLYKESLVTAVVSETFTNGICFHLNAYISFLPKTSKISYLGPPSALSRVPILTSLNNF